MILKVPGATKDMGTEWTIISPNSRHHPGRHEGRLVLHTDYPFRNPQIVWDSTILSPFVWKGHLSVAYGLTDGWSPAMASFYSVLHSIAAIVARN